MIRHSNAYILVRDKNQELLDFTVLCCQAIPALKGYIKAVEKGAAPKLPDADHFKGQPDFSSLREHARIYKKTLGKVLLLSTFSYFELYFKTLLKEIIEFDNLSSKLKSQKSYCEDEQLTQAINKLRQYRKPYHKLQYQKFSNLAKDEGFVFPSIRFSIMGIEYLEQKIKDLKANDIPNILERDFGLVLSEDDIQKFHKYREDRNNIAHGGNQDIEFKEGIDACKFFRELAKNIDEYFVKNFFILEE